MPAELTITGALKTPSGVVNGSLFDVDLVNLAVLDQGSAVLFELAHHHLGEASKAALVLAATTLEHHLLHDQNLL
jgi:hypothetical protein